MENFEKKNLNIFLFTQIISSFAYAFSSTIFSYQTLALTGSSFKLALSIVMNNIPKIFLLHLAGILADKLDKRKLFILVDMFYFLSFVAILTLTFIFKSASAEANLIIIGSFILGLLRAFSIPITKSIVPVLAPKDKLLKANSYEISNDKIARTLGPIISIIILSSLGFNAAIIIAGLAYLLIGFSKTFLTINGAIERKNSSKPSNILQEIYESALSLFKRRAIILLVLSAILTQLLFHPFNYIVLPSLFSKLKNDSNLPLMEMLLNIVSLLKLSKKNLWLNFIAFINLGGALGTLLSLVCLSLFENRVSNKNGITLAVIGKAFFGSLTVLAVSYFGYFGNDSNLSTLIILLFLINIGLFFSFNLFTIYFAHYYQKEIPREELGKFIANFMVFFNLSSSLGSLVYGFASENNLHISLFLLSIGVLLKIVLHLLFLSTNQEKTEKAS